MLKFVLTAFTLLVFFQASANDSPHVFTANLGLNLTRIKNINDSGFGVMGGGKYSYFFSPKVGVFGGLDYVQRNASEIVSSNKLEFQLDSLDLPFGLAFRYASWADLETMTFLGLYYNMPLSGTAKVSPNSADIDSSGHLGLLLQTESYFEVNPSFDLGFFAGIKFGFANSIDKVGNASINDDTNTFDVSLGIGARF